MTLQKVSLFNWLIGYLLLDKRQFITILHFSYLELMHDIKLWGRAFWRHNLDMLYIRAGLCHWNFTPLSPAVKSPAWWSGSSSCLPLWLSPNASISKFDLAATSSLISLTFKSWIDWIVERQSLHLVFLRENQKAILLHVALNYHTFQTCKRAKRSLLSDFSSCKMRDVCILLICYSRYCVQDAPDQGKDCQGSPAGERIMGGVQEAASIQPNGQVLPEWYWANDQWCWRKSRPERLGP